MARLFGPEDRLVATITNGLLHAKPDRPAVVYLDEAMTTLADILDEDGVAVPDSTLTIDSFSQLPIFQFPDDVRIVWVSIDGGPAWPLYPRQADQIDTLGSTVAGQYAVDAYGADPTGVADSTAAFNAALAAMPTRAITNANGSATYPVGQLVLGAGTYRLGTSSDVGNLGPFVSVAGRGSGATVIDYRGSAQALRVYNSIRPTSDTFIDLEAYGTQINGLTVDGSNAGAGASGIKYGDVEGGYLGPDLMIRDFDKTGSAGLRLWNEFAWTEDIGGRVTLRNNTIGLHFRACEGNTSQNGYIGGDNSFMYCHIDVKIYAFGNQNGVVLDNGATYQGGVLDVRANMQNGSVQPTGALLSLIGVAPVGHLGAGTRSQIVNCRLTLQGETNGPGAFGPRTVYMDDVVACYLIATGLMSFEGGKWLKSNYSLGASFANGNFRFLGYVKGDTNLSPADGHGAIAGALLYPTSILFNDGGMPVHAGDFFTITLSQNVTIDVQQGVAGPQKKTIIVRQATSGGPFTLTWPKPGSPTVNDPRFLWAGGTAPTMSTGAGVYDVYEIVTTDGLTWYAARIAAAVS